MLVQGEALLGEPVLDHWTELEDTEGPDQRSDESAAAAAGSKRPRGDAFKAAERGGDARSPKRQLPEPAP